MHETGTGQQVAQLHERYMMMMNCNHSIIVPPPPPFIQKKKMTPNKLAHEKYFSGF